MLLFLLFEDEVVFGSNEVLDDELLLALEMTFDEEEILLRVADLEDVAFDETLEEDVVLEEDDVLMEVEA
ncbi:hypothetical protein QM012_007569 [Aureobasidium pullulans]|uniref:Uncharacterized protein n=1 Tax=Aureobasidium pullulans TaxID=5580 RepID=A0ABR0TND9_AURPU